MWFGTVRLMASGYKHPTKQTSLVFFFLVGIGTDEGKA